MGPFCKPAKVSCLSRFVTEETETQRTSSFSSSLLVIVPLQAEVYQALIRHTAATISMNPPSSPAT